MRFLSLSLALLFFSACSIAQETKQSFEYNESAVFPKNYKDQVGDTLKLMTWNVENFVDEHDNPYISNYREDSTRASQEKIQLFAQAIKNADADIVVLQEIEGAPYLKALANEHFPEMGYQFFADHESNNWFQNVAIMSRVPLGPVVGYGTVHTPVEFNEDGEEKYQTQDYINTRMWSCAVWVNEHYQFHLTAAHLKAGRGERNEAMRLGQIAFLKSQLQRELEIDKKANLLLVGDLNSLPNSRELGALKTGKKRIALQDPLGSEVSTHPADKPERRLDYILFNKNTADEIVEQSANVPLLLENAEAMRTVSDHLPVTIEILVDENQQ